MAVELGGDTLTQTPSPTSWIPEPASFQVPSCRPGPADHGHPGAPEHPKLQGKEQEPGATLYNDCQNDATLRIEFSKEEI